MRPTFLRFCFHCNGTAVYSVACRHGKEFPTCKEHVGDALDKAFPYDGDGGHVDVYELRMYYHEADTEEKDA